MTSLRIPPLEELQAMRQSERQKVLNHWLPRWRHLTSEERRILEAAEIWVRHRPSGDVLSMTVGDLRYLREAVGDESSSLPLTAALLSEVIES